MVKNSFKVLLYSCLVCCVFISCHQTTDLSIVEKQKELDQDIDKLLSEIEVNASVENNEKFLDLLNGKPLSNNAFKILDTLNYLEEFEGRINWELICYHDDHENDHLQEFRRYKFCEEGLEKHILENPSHRYDCACQESR